MSYALYLNGVYESVLKEIVNTQNKNPDLVCYLQPYAPEKIVNLSNNPPTKDSPITVYISITSDLSVVTYQAQIVGWENKIEIQQDRLSFLNGHITDHQPGEEGIYLTVGEGEKQKNCVNLISVLDLKRVASVIPISTFIKVSNNLPLKVRSTSGGWAYVKPLPDWMGTITQNTLIEDLNANYQSSLQDSLDLDKEELANKLLNAPKLPAPILTIARGFKRNSNVSAAVLIRAEGKCERCKSVAPFIRARNGTPYLEVHHILMLAKGGEDTVENAIALCPNCHRELHHGI